ncbi:uncharacterized protein EDB93DRAFT_925803 [Suillus bovinus]|uniref:uncharacterized protein n=1 Tax=Suillus bovinus TaxID=48563 RepID=UPI001B87B792|nr:uncharacterized protein EDB93DRAFT_925803 [Suillus bovinus]KAG2156660.1 hypothetical protein EDB93DRAFT_925803 [Suillus bovinus]
MSIGYHGQNGSVSRTFPRPPVCAISVRPPTADPQSRPRTSESGYVMVHRPPVCAVSFKHPTTGPQSRHRKFESVTVPHPPFKPPTTVLQSRHCNSDSVVFSRPPLCGISFEPPTTGPQSRHPRRSSFNYATGHDYSDGRQHSVYILPPTTPAPQIDLPPRQRKRTVSVEVIRRLPFLSREVPPFQKSNSSGLTRTPFNRLCSATISISQKICRKTAGK